MNPAAKRLVEQTVVASGLLPLMGRRLKAASLVLAYHNIVPHGESRFGDASLHLPQQSFARQLDALRRTHDVVPLIDLLDLAKQASARRPRVAITFDDAYRGALTAGVSELVERGLPATVYVTPALLGKSTWWDLLATESDGAVPEAMRQHALEALRGDREAVLEWAASVKSDSSTSRPRYEIGDEALLRTAAAQPGISLGSHTWSHKNLSVLDARTLEDELTRPLAWLRERFMIASPTLTYPYGLHSPAVDQAAADAGYTAAFRVEGGWLVGGRSNTPFALPRYNVPAGLSLDGFRIRLAGIGTGS